VKDSIAHGIGRAKAIAFAAIPAVIEKGTIIGETPDWKGRGYRGIVLAAPVKISDADYVVAAVLRGDNASQRFYLHEVGLKDRLQPDAFKTGASADTSGEPSGASSGALLTILRDIFAVKFDDGENSLYAKGGQGQRSLGFMGEQNRQGPQKRLTWTAEDEEKHPRDADGKFADKSLDEIHAENEKYRRDGLAEQFRRAFAERYSADFDEKSPRGQPENAG
jgi:hypothetical protein